MIDFSDQIQAELRERDRLRDTHDLVYPGGTCRQCGVGPHTAGRKSCMTLEDRQAEFIQRMWITWCDTGDERYWKAYHRALRALDIGGANE